MSTVSQGSSQTGVDIALAGLSLQVIFLVAFSALFADYMIRYARSKSTAALNRRVRTYLSCLAAAILLILGRSTYRCYELSKGYQHSTTITNEGLFIGLEGV